MKMFNRVRMMDIDGRRFYDIKDLLFHFDMKTTDIVDVVVVYSWWAAVYARQPELSQINIRTYEHHQEGSFLITIDAFTKATEALSDLTTDPDKTASYLKWKSALLTQAALPRQQIRLPEGFVYIIATESDMSLYKIGVAKQLATRLSSLQTGMASKLILIHAIHCEGYGDIETFLHDRYSSRHERGEWFRLTPADISEIKSIVVNHPNIEIIPSTQEAK